MILIIMVCRFPSSEHPVLAMYNVPGSFPSLPGNKFIQKYIKWNSSLLAEADKVKQMLFGGEKYLGIHLRVGEDWVISLTIRNYQDLNGF